MPKLPDEVKILNQVLSLLQPLEKDVRTRLLGTISAFFETRIGQPQPAASSQPRSGTPAVTNGEDEPTAKDFILHKSPGSQVERMACLAYYLMRFRSKPDFKTKDLTDLNAEARAGAITNPAMTTQNAAMSGYLVPSSGGNKRLSAQGERLVDALPDREAANAVKATMRGKTKRKKAKAKAKA